MKEVTKSGKGPKPNVNFNIDVNQLLKDMFSDGSRNDLAIAVENGTDQMWQVEWNNEVGHGDFHNKKYNSTLEAIDPYSSPSKNSTDFELSFEAVGAGCNVVLKIKLNNKDDSFFGIMAATPSNYTNYLKGHYYDHAKKIEDVWDDLNDNYDKHYGSEGAFIIDAPEELNIKAEITIEEDSPAGCIIELKMKS